MKTPTNPDHKCIVGYTANCSCGWQSSMFFEGNHARRAALSEWRAHRAECERRKDKMMNANHFTTREAAIEYHQTFGWTETEIEAGFANGSIKVGPPPVNDGEYPRLHDGGRYSVARNSDR